MKIVLAAITCAAALGCTSTPVRQRATIEPDFPYGLREGDNIERVLSVLDREAVRWDTSRYKLNFDDMGAYVRLKQPKLFGITFDSAYFLVDDKAGMRLADFRMSPHDWSWDSIQAEFERVREILISKYGEPNISGEPAVIHKDRPDLRNRWRQTVDRPELNADITWYFTAAVFWYKIYDGWYTEVY